MNNSDKTGEVPRIDLEGVSFKDLFSLEDVQRLQDLFADAHEVASVITDPGGNPMTQPSKSNLLCNDLICKTEKDCAHCSHSEVIIHLNNPGGPIIQPCLGGILMVAHIGIWAGGRHLANWIIGQVQNDSMDKEEMLTYIEKIGANRDDFMLALNEVPKMSEDKFTKIAKLLFAFVNDLSAKSFDKLRQQPDAEGQLHKQLEEQILKSKLRYDNLVSNIPVGVYILLTKPDASFTLDYVSPRMAEMLDLSSETLMASGDAVFNAIHPDDLEGFVRLNLEGIQKMQPFDWKGRAIVKGVVKWLHFRSKPQVLENGDTLWHGLIIDITERIIADAEIKHQNGELVKLNAEKDKFFSIIAHDLRSPFNSFLGLTQIMAEDLPSLTMAQVQEIAVKMSKSASNLYRLIENLLEWSQIKNGVFSYNPEVIHLSWVVTGCIDMILVSAKNKDIEIENNIAEGVEVLADRNMIQTIIRNLVSNAVKFTPKGGKVVLSAKAAANQILEITVQDSGIGMSKTLIDKLFRIDSKTNRLGTDNEPSSGLGLLLCKEFIEKHGGRIWVKSKVGKGSRFTFSIPMV